MILSTKETIAQLLDNEEQEKEKAAQKIMLAAKSDAVKFIPHLQTILESGDVDSRWWAVRTLAGIPHPQSVCLLMSALSDPDEDVQVCAIMGLGEKKEGRAIDRLLELLPAANEYVARHIGDALSKIGEAAAPGLVMALDHERILVRVQAARSLVRIESQQAIPALIKALDDPEPLVEHYAWEALQRMGVGVTVFFRP